MKYFLLDRSIVLIENGVTHTVSSDDHRYDLIKEGIQNENFDAVHLALNPPSLVEDGFSINNGLVFYKDQPIPSVLGNKFIGINKNSFEFKSLFNLWYNMKTREIGEDIASDIITKLLNHDAYAVTEDGFYLVYLDNNTDQTESSLNKNNQKCSFHFYNYAKCHNSYAHQFRSKTSFDDIIESSFGFVTKKIKKLAIKNLFVEGNNHICDNFFFYGEAFRDILAKENIVYAIENDLLDTNLGDYSNYVELRTLLKDLTIDKNNNYSQKKALNFIESCNDKEHLVEIGNYYNSVKSEFNIDIQDLNTSNFKEIYDYLLREYARIKDPVFFLNNDRKIDNLSEEEFDRFRIIIPRTNHDLKAWGIELHQCVASYANRVKNKECHIIGIEDKSTKKLVYNIELARKKIMQFTGKRNTKPTSNDRFVVENFLKEKGLIYKE